MKKILSFLFLIFACFNIAESKDSNHFANTGLSAKSLSFRVDIADGKYITNRLVKNDKHFARKNTLLMSAIMLKAPKGSTVYFPEGDYYFDGSALPNHSSIESSNTGQIFRGDGVGTTRIIQINDKKDFGFTCRTDFKRVPTATIRIRHKGCMVENLTVMFDEEIQPKTVINSVAIQIAHIAYFPDNNIGIIETTGLGEDFLIDHVIISNVNIGEHLGSGIAGSRFFEVGIDIIGSGGHVRISNMNRIDARTGVRLDNGNHCGQGEYEFSHMHNIGNTNVFKDGVFFDWVGGQAPSIQNSSCSCTNGIFAGPRGKSGDRLNPFPEAEVVRRKNSEWDWFTLHNHTVVDQPNEMQRREWYGLPRYAKIVRIGSTPRTGGKEWIEGKDFIIQDILSGDCKGALKIIWKGERPSPNSTYYVTFQQSAEYRVHDLEWGNAINVSIQEANATSPDGFAVKYSDQGVGYLNPDFRFGIGYNFLFSGMFIINGNLFFEGDIDLINISALTSGVCNINLMGMNENRNCRRISINNSSFNYLKLGEYTQKIHCVNNFIDNKYQIKGDIKKDVIEYVKQKEYIFESYNNVEIIP